MATLPRIVVLGGPVPDDLRTDLADNLEVVDADGAGDGQVSAVLLYAVGDALPALRRFRDSGGSVPVYGYTLGPAPVGARLDWIREGAEDLLDAADAAEALVRRIRGDGERSSPVDTEAPVAVRLDRYLVALDQYLALRRELTRRLGDVGVTRYLETVVLRQRVMRASDEVGGPIATGERRGSLREEMPWSARLVDAPEEWVELQNVSADGVGIVTERELRPRTQVRLEIEGLTVSAQIELEIRWRRRRGPRWEAGGWATRATITRSS